MNHDFTRFKRTRVGYRRADNNQFTVGQQFAELMEELILIKSRTPQEPEAWSFCKYEAGRMNSETWKNASAIMLEYLVGDDKQARLDEVLEAADKLGYAYYIIDTQTRYHERTYTLVFPLSETIIARRYSRIASVLATQLGLYNAAPGIQAHTHLIHIHAESSAGYRPGLVINPEFFIKMTKEQAQEIDPQQFERPCAAHVHVQKPVWTCAEEGLFSGL